MQEKVLVTGGAGFIGSNLCDALLDKGYAVRCLDNFATGKRANIEGCLSHPDFELIEGDIRDYETCLKACAGADYVLHQAALGSVPRSINDPLTSNDVNVGGFLNMLKAAGEQKVKNFVYAASSSTYGDSEALPKVEDRVGRPLSPYAVTKLVNEIYAGVFNRVYGINTIGLRYFNVFGQRQDPDGAYAAVIPKFTMQLINYESPVINGNGDYSRDFTYIDNVVQMNLLAMKAVDPDALNQVYNTAAGDRITIRQMTELLRDYLSAFDERISATEIKFGPVRNGDVPHSQASIEKAQSRLGYRPSHSFSEGLKEAVEWYWANLKETEKKSKQH